MPEKKSFPEKVTLDNDEGLKDCAPSSEAGPIYLIVAPDEARKLGVRILARYQAAFETLRNI